MAAQNSILLIIKQSNGIKYNTLLSKISGNYSNINSARAALSRAIKYFNALGYIVKSADDSFSLTHKGLAKLGTEMRNKLLIRLHDLLSDKNSIENIDAIVEQFSTVIARSTEDIDLLKMAKNSSEFHISDLEKLSKELEKKAAHLTYLNGIIKHHIETLKKMDFRDYWQTELSEAAIAELLTLAEQEQVQDFFLAGDESFLKKLNETLAGEFKSSHLFYPIAQLSAVLVFLQKELFSNPVPLKPTQTMSIFLGALQFKFENFAMVVFAPYAKIKHKR
ncbi:MAG: hypothetical protein Q7S92_02590 [Candidatus Diapherotrites archaeon]|nr:hypothetical protein [Candidatus Diapherotrites archaeon]